MKRKPQQPPLLPPSSLHNNDLQEIASIKSQLAELRHRNDLMQTQIRNTIQSNNTKRNMNNNLRQTFKSLCNDMEELKMEHLMKVQEKLKNEEGPVSDLIKENGFGLSPFALMKIPAFRYQKKEESDICMGCYEELKHNSKCKALACEHVFHSQCLDQYLLVSKQCPACGVDVNL